MKRRKKSIVKSALLGLGLGTVAGGALLYGSRKQYRGNYGGGIIIRPKSRAVIVRPNYSMVRYAHK